MSTLETLRLHSGTLLDLQVKGYNLKILLQQIGVQDAINIDWLIEIGTEVLKWSRLRPNFVHVREALI